LVIQRISPRIAGHIAKPVRVIANALFILLFLVVIVLVVVAPDLRAMLWLGWRPTVVIIIMVGVSLAIGHLLSGPLQERRSVLAVASIARNVGLALFIASFCDYGQQFIPTLLTYMILGSLLAVPYTVWSKRRMTTR
jgi:BASS family bile acid:Na+ symporter